jgi:hypothetical protein
VQVEVAAEAAEEEYQAVLVRSDRVHEGAPRDVAPWLEEQQQEEEQQGQ